MLSEYRLHDKEELVCPRCGKKSIVLHGDSTYVCIDHRCGFRNDVSEGGVGSAGQIVAGFLGVIVLFVFLQSCSPNQAQGSNHHDSSLFRNLQSPSMVD
jgi:hypothetical protein